VFSHSPNGAAWPLAFQNITITSPSPFQSDGIHVRLHAEPVDALDLHWNFGAVLGHGDDVAVLALVIRQLTFALGVLLRVAYHAVIVGIVSPHAELRAAAGDGRGIE
jgi:hypothetical protein